MRAQLRCRACGHGWTLSDEPRALARLGCPACGAAPPRRPSEDFASAVEDALSQLWQLGRVHDVALTLRSDALPRDFDGDGA